MEFKDFIKKIRKDRELSLIKMGELTGVSYGNLNNYENGVRSLPTLEVSDKISRGLNLSKDEKFQLYSYITPKFILDELKLSSQTNGREEYYIPFFSNIKVAAGRGKLNWDYSTTKFKIGEKFSKAGYVACTVEGDSMVPDIVEGDILILDTKEPSNVNGKIFVVNYNGEVYLKEIYIEGDAVVLHSKNGSYKPIIVTDKSKLHIVGKVMAIYREY